MKIYLYNSEGFYIETIEKTEGIEYSNSTEIAPDFSYDLDIYDYIFDKFSNKWFYEYRNDFINKKAKELNLEISILRFMNINDIMSGNLPPLNEVEQEIMEERQGIIKPRKRSKK